MYDKPIYNCQLGHNCNPFNRDLIHETGERQLGKGLGRGQDKGRLRHGLASKKTNWEIPGKWTFFQEFAVEK